MSKIYKKTIKIRYRNFKNINIKSAVDHIKSYDWSRIYDESDINSKANLLNNALMSLSNDIFPIKTFSSKHRPVPWMNDNIKNKMKIKL